jgi:cytochrome c556
MPPDKKEDITVMKKTAFAFGLVAALALPALASEDPIATRKALMQSNAAAAAVSAAMMRGELDYSPAIGKAAITAMHATAIAYGDYFPEGSTGENTSAAARIWEDMDGFMAALGEFRTATDAAVTASGREGPADAAAFTAAVQPVLGTCRTCHEAFRIDD